MKRMSQHVESLEVEKEALEGKVKQHGEKLVTEESRRKVLEKDVEWIL